MFIYNNNTNNEFNSEKCTKERKTVKNIQKGSGHRRKFKNKIFEKIKSTRTRKLTKANQEFLKSLGFKLK